MLSKTIIAKISFLALFFLSSIDYALEPFPTELVDVGVTEQIDHVISSDYKFHDSQGKLVKLDSFFSDKPVVLSFVYYSCPMLCNLIATGVKNLILNSNTIPLGESYKIVSISIDPSDTVLTATAFKNRYIDESFSNQYSDPEWHFLYGETVKNLAKEVGFNYNYLPESGEFAHTASIIVLSPTRKVTRYLYGIEFDEKDFKLAIAEAKNEKSRSTLEKVMLFCYMYDPDKRGFVIHAWRLMRLGGILTVAFILGSIIYLRRNERKNKNGN